MLFSLKPIVFLSLLCDTKDAGVGEAPNCASCHTYPPNEGSHGYHLYSKDLREKMSEKPGLNGLMTCMIIDTTRGAALAAEIDVLIKSYVIKKCWTACGAFRWKRNLMW